MFSSLKVSAGNAAFPDFTNPDTEKWWLDMTTAFHKQIPFDGVCLVNIIHYIISSLDFDLLI